MGEDGGCVLSMIDSTAGCFLFPCFLEVGHPYCATRVCTAQIRTVSRHRGSAPRHPNIKLLLLTVVVCRSRTGTGPFSPLQCLPSCPLATTARRAAVEPDMGSVDSSRGWSSLAFSRFRSQGSAHDRPMPRLPARDTGISPFPRLSARKVPGNVFSEYTLILRDLIGTLLRPRSVVPSVPRRRAPIKVGAAMMVGLFSPDVPPLRRVARSDAARSSTRPHRPTTDM